MKIQDKDIYYGVVINQLAEYPTFTSINKVNDKDGLYQINGNRRILIKYSKAEKDWKFTFQKDDFIELNYWDFYIVLVCGEYTICLLSYNDIVELLDKDCPSSQWVTISYPEGGQMRVRGTLGNLSRTVAHNAFPKNLFGEDVKIEDKYKWPPLSRLNFYRGAPNLIFSTEDRLLDFAHSLMDTASDYNKSRTVYFGLTTTSHKWKNWSEKNIKRIEDQIVHDFRYDGFKVNLERITDQICPYTKKKTVPCDNEFIWKLEIEGNL